MTKSLLLWGPIDNNNMYIYICKKKRKKEKEKIRIFSPYILFLVFVANLSTPSYLASCLLSCIPIASFVHSTHTHRRSTGRMPLHSAFHTSTKVRCEKLEPIVENKVFKIKNKGMPLALIFSHQGLRTRIYIANIHREYTGTNKTDVNAISPLTVMSPSQHRRFAIGT